MKKKKNLSHFILPGGKIESGEQIKEALIRELLEEVSISVKEKDLKYLLEFNVKSQFSDESLITTLYYLNSEKDLVNVSPDNEIASCKWIDLDNYDETELASGVLLYGIPEAKKINGGGEINNKKIIIFDLDNTLYDFKKNWEISHMKVFEEFNLDKDIDYNVLMDAYRKEDNRLWELLNNGDMTLSELRIYRPINTLKLFKKNISYNEGQCFYDLMFKHLISNIQSDNEINKILEKLSSVYQLIILTNGFSKEQNLKIRNLEIEPYISNIYISENIGMEKPDLRLFQKVIADENVLPENVLMIGDSLKNDILPAKEVGMKTLHLNYSEVKIYDFSTVLGGF